MRFPATLRSLALVVTVVSLSGCGLLGFGKKAPPQTPGETPAQTPPPRETPALRPVVLTIVGAPDMNAGGNAALVKLYPLRGTTTLLGTVVESFWRSGGDVGADLAGEGQEVLVYPGETTTVEINPGADARFLGVAADLRSPETDAWRKALDVPTVRGRTVRILVGARAIETTVQ